MRSGVLEIPVERRRRVGFVGAEEAGLYGAIEVATERWAVGLDLSDDLSHGAGHVQTGALGVRAGAARAAAEAARAAELVGEHVHLLAQARRPPDVVQRLG